MKNHNNKKFYALMAGGSLAIVILLVIICSQNLDDRYSYPGMMSVSSDSDMYSFAVGGMDGMAYREEGGKTMMFADMATSESFAPAPEASMSGGITAAEADQRIIKTADLAIGVDGVEAKAQEIATLATGRGGFVQSSTVMEDDYGYKSAYVTVRVPSDSFEASIEAIKDLAVRVDRESISGQDVTEQYTDLEARLRSAQAQEEQYLVILDKAETVQDILSVQSYLQSVRYEIESLQGQIQSLGNQTAYSTISVSLSEEVRLQVPAEKFDLVRDIKLALKAVVLLAQTSLTYLVWFIIVGGAVLIPTAVLVAVVVMITRKLIAKL